MTNIHFMSNSYEWITPQELFNELDDEFDFTLDPCATHENHKCEQYYTIEDDGLAQSWDGERVFMNPPYGRYITKWIKKAYESKALVVGLLPARTDTRWFHDYIYHKADGIRFIKGRIRFSYSKPAPFPSMVVIWR